MQLEKAESLAAFALDILQGFNERLLKMGKHNNDGYTALQAAVKELREQGLCSSEISERLGKPTKTINATANKIGMPFTEEEKQRSIEIGRIKSKPAMKSEGTVVEWLAKYAPDYDYVSGTYTGSEGGAVVRCKICGAEFFRKSVSIRHGLHQCESCLRIESDKRKQDRREAQKEAQELKAEERRRIKEEQAQAKEADRQNKMHSVICVECGKQFETYLNRVTCSSECAKRHINRAHDRRLKKYGQKENGITIRKLYKRDNGICYICGKRCDWNDKQTASGTIICGDDYPSIEHVIPLSLGGWNDWDNVKLACRGCNTKKRTASLVKCNADGQLCLNI